MSSEVEVVTGSCTVGGESFGVTSLNAHIAINTWPTYTVGVLIGAKGNNSAV